MSSHLGQMLLQRLQHKMYWLAKALTGPVVMFNVIYFSLVLQEAGVEAEIRHYRVNQSKTLRNIQVSLSRLEQTLFAL